MTKTRQNRLELQKQNMAHPWRVGDLCNALYNEIGAGVIYRVMDVKVTDRVWSGNNRTSLTVTPVHGVVSDISNRRPRTLDSAFCRPLSIVDLSTEYASLGNFIRDEVKKRSETDDPRSGNV